MSGFLRRMMAIARSEGRYLLREPRTLVVCFVEPIVMLILFGYCLSFDLIDVPFAVWDQDRTTASRDLVRTVRAGTTSHTFKYLGDVRHPSEIEPLLGGGTARLVLVIPRGYARALSGGRRVAVQGLIDGSDSNTAAVAGGFLGAAIASHNAGLSVHGTARRHGSTATFVTVAAGLGGGRPVSEPIDVRWRVLYNPDLSSRRFIIPGLMAVLLSILAATLTSTAITRERELGSLESLLISPARPSEVVAGKMLPYLAISAVNVALVLVLGGLVFGVWPRGSVLTLAVFTMLFLPGMLSVGLIISCIAPTQNFALVLATLLGFLPTMFLTGFAFPRSNMSWLVQVLSWPLPATQYLAATRGIFLKGVGWEVLASQALWLTGSTSVLVFLAIRAVAANMARGLE
jgi:ABC-2 type transport system permease protein